MKLFFELIGCLMATLFFAELLRTPRSTMLYTGLISICGYIVYIAMGMTTTAFFASSLIVSLLCEVVARIKKMTTTLFLVCGIIPLVPGLGLYRAVMFLAQNRYLDSLKTAVEALTGIGAIALAITFSTMLFSNIPMRWFHKKGDTHAPTHHQR